VEPLWKMTGFQCSIYPYIRVPERLNRIPFAEFQLRKNKKEMIKMVKKQNIMERIENNSTPFIP
jgi:hypothetical protein